MPSTSSSNTKQTKDLCVESWQHHERREPELTFDRDVEASVLASTDEYCNPQTRRRVPPSLWTQDDTPVAHNPPNTNNAVTSPTSRGIQLVMLVSDLLKQCDDDTKTAFKQGNPNVHSPRLDSIYQHEQETHTFGRAYRETEDSSSTSSSPKSSSPEQQQQDEGKWLDISIRHGSQDYGKQSSLEHRTTTTTKSTLTDPAHPETDPFAVREGHDLIWKDVNMTIKGKQERKVLDQVWGQVPKKQTTAIMGGSGAGKTSLLNILAGRTRSGGNLHVQSSIRVDDLVVDPTNISVRQNIAFVAQDDSLQSTATPREAIRFSAKLRLGRFMTNEQLDHLTHCMLQELGLSECADTVVGNLLIKGISGGERKRTSVGVELVVKPAMVFLDEPTSGLDSFSSVQVCQLLKKVARAGASVLFTVHQPSSRIFREFDHLILLHQGRIMYTGSVDKVADYFGSRGYSCPRNYNPADHIMKVAQKNSVKELEQAGFFPKDEREMEQPRRKHSTKLSGLFKGLLSRSKRLQKPPSLLTEVSMLFRREYTHISRNRIFTVARLFHTSFLGTLIGLVFMDVGAAPSNTVSNLQSHFGAIVITSAVVMMGPAQAALISFPEERPIFLREYTTKHYSVSSYFVSRLLVEMILTGITAMLMNAISFYLIDFQGSFSTFYFCFFTLAMGSTAIAVVLGALSGSSAKIATGLLPMALLPQMLFIGYFVNPDLIPSWLRWVNYICPMTYSTRILLLEEFHDCSDDFIEKIYCTRLLENVGAVAEDRWWYWWILGAQFVGFRLLALGILQRSARKFY